MRWGGTWKEVKPEEKPSAKFQHSEWASTRLAARGYDAGEVAVFRNRALVSKVDHNRALPITFDGPHPDWVMLGELGPSPSRVVHVWHPEPVQYPCGDAGEMSEPVSVCSDCFKDGDYRNMFNAKVHLYVIPEWGHGLV